jgi:hypothetical protein
MILFIFLIEFSLASICGVPEILEKSNSIQGPLSEFTDFKCPDWILNKSSLPKCPRLGVEEVSSLPGYYPKAFVSLSGSLSSSSQLDIIRQSVKSNPLTLPVFNISVYDKSAIIKELAKEFPRIPWQSHIVEGLMGGVYQRDFYSNRINSKGNAETFAVMGASSDELGQLLEKCGMSYSPKNSSEIKEHSDFVKGGNFVSIIPNLNVVQAGLSGGHSYAGYSKENTIILPALTTVQHADEIIMPLRKDIDSNGCPKITTLIASPDKTMELLKKNPKEKFLSRKLLNDPMALSAPTRSFSARTADIESGLYEAAFLKRLCDFYYELPSNQNIDIEFKPVKKIVFRSGSSRGVPLGEKRNKIIQIPHDMPSNDVARLFSEKLGEISEGAMRTFEYDSSLLDDSQLQNIEKKIHELEIKLGEKNFIPRITRSLSYSDAKGKVKHCEDLSRHEVYQVLNHGNFKNDAGKLQKDVSFLKSEIENRLKVKHPNCSNMIDWIDTPVVFENKNWVLPNAVNALPLNNKAVAMPEPYSSVFKDYLESELSKRDISPVWVDTFGLNNSKGKNVQGGGNLHCASYSIPICSP